MEIGVQPFATSCTRLGFGDGDQLGSYALASSVRRYQRIDHEGVDRTIPCDVDKPDEAVGIPSAHPSETVLMKLCLPVIVEDPVVEPLGVQRVHFCVVEIAAPFVPETHANNVAISAFAEDRADPQTGQPCGRPDRLPQIFARALSEPKRVEHPDTRCMRAGLESGYPHHHGDVLVPFSAAYIVQ